MVRRLPRGYICCMSKDYWRITTAAIQLEMERISGLLQKSAHFQSRTSAPHTVRERNQADSPESASAPSLEIASRL